MRSDRVPFLGQVLGRFYSEIEGEIKDEKALRFLEDNYVLAHEMLVTSDAGSQQEYLAMSVLEAMVALRKGNYGIGAVYSIKRGDKEFLISGQNTLFTQGHAHGHAEHGAMKNVVNLAHGRIEDMEHVIAVRERVDESDKDHAELTTTLEPCPMCMLGMLNHAGQTGHLFDKALIGAQDPGGAFWLNHPQKKLPPVWVNILKRSGIELNVAAFSEKSTSWLSRNMAVIWKKLLRATGTEIIDAPHIEEKYKKLLFDVFLVNAKEVDDRITNPKSKVVDMDIAARTITDNFPFDGDTHLD